MTVNKNNLIVFVLPVLLFLGSVSFAAGNKTILRLHFETKRVKPGTLSVVLNTTYKIEASKPYTFTGFSYQFNYDPSTISPITTFFDGTASGFAAFAHGNNDARNHIYHVVVDNTPQTLDTTNHLLFQIWYHLGGITDSAMITPIIFDIDTSNHIDSIVIDNTVWDPKFQWHSFGLVFPDTTKPPPPVKVPVTL